jgi:hypothetical protein
VPTLEPMGGCRPIDTYGASPYNRRRKAPPDCPCNGAIPPGSKLVCLHCHKSGFDPQLAARRQQTQAREEAAWEEQRRKAGRKLDEIKSDKAKPPRAGTVAA